MDSGLCFLSIIAFFLLAGWIVGIRTVEQGDLGVVRTFGRYTRRVGPGLHWIMPGIQNLDVRDARVIALDISDQRLLTSDRIPVNIDAFLTYQVIDPKAAMFQVANIPETLQHLGRGQLRSNVATYNAEGIAERGNQQRIEQEITNTLTADLQARFGINVKATVEAVRLPPDYEAATTAVRVAQERRRAKVTDAEAEADVTRIERSAEDPYWLGKTWADAIEHGLTALAEAISKR